jgi:hypothetical protein
MVKNSQIAFYFTNRVERVTQGCMYVLDLSKVLQDWKGSKPKRPKTVN